MEKIMDKICCSVKNIFILFLFILYIYTYPMASFNFFLSNLGFQRAQF